MTPWSISIRTLARRPAFALAAVLTLSVGIAATTTMFSVVDTVLIKALPFPNADRLTTVMETNPSKTDRLSLIAPGRLEEWNAANGTFAAISGWYSENQTDTSGAERAAERTARCPQVFRRVRDDAAGRPAVHAR